MNHPAIRFYFKKGRWRVTAGGSLVPAKEWWDAINHVKYMNHKLRIKNELQANAERQPRRG